MPSGERGAIQVHLMHAMVPSAVRKPRRLGRVLRYTPRPPAEVCNKVWMMSYEATQAAR